MKNFNRCSAVPIVTTAQSAASWRNEHTYVDRTHAFSHTLKSIQLQPRCAKRQRSYFLVHAGSFCVSVFHRTRTWTTWSLTCVRDHSCACVYTRGLGTPTTSQHIFDSEKLTKFVCTRIYGIRTSVLCISSPTLYHLSHPTPRHSICRVSRPAPSTTDW